MIQSKKDLNFYLLEDAKRFNLTSWIKYQICLLYTSDAADDSLRVDLGGRRIIKKLWVVDGDEG